MKNGFLTDLVAKNRRHKIKWRVSSALLAGIALLFALQGFTRAEEDDHNATAKTDCTPISQAGQYFLANDLTCPGGISITVSHVKLELRGHTMVGTLLSSVILVNGGGASLSKIEIEGPGTVFGGLAGIEFDDVHHSWVHNVVAVGNVDGIDIGASGCTPNPAIAATASTDNMFSDNVAAANGLCGISVNGGNHNSFIHNNLTGNQTDGLLFFNAKKNDVRQNTVDANGLNGIEVGMLGSGNMIDHNTAFGNGQGGSAGVDLLDNSNNNMCPPNNTWTNNSFNLNSPPVCIK
jgi:parallel beta-helix repeat protein